MCGRYVIKTPLEELAREFNAKPLIKNLHANFNASPSLDLPIVVHDNGNVISLCAWGFMPPFKSDFAKPMINARAETVTQKPSFRSAFKHSRCLVIADGFYEWLGEGKSKRPFYARLKSDRPLGLAGIFSSGEDGRCTFAIITTAANSLLKIIHDRMPVILPKKKESIWLEQNDPAQLKALLKPLPSSQMDMYEVNHKVNSTHHNSEDNIQPIA